MDETSRAERPVLAISSSGATGSNPIASSKAR